MKKATKNLTEGNLYRNFILFAFPLVLSSLLSQAFGMVDTMIAGRFIGDTALAATGAASSFHAVFNSPFYGFFSGMGVYTAHLFGGGRYRELRSSLYSTMLVLFGIIFLLSGIGIVCYQPLFRYLRIDPAIWQEAKTYFIIIMCGKVLVLGNSFGVNVLYAFGNSKFPFWASIFSSSLNLVGNVVTVTQLHWGVAGIAISTLVSAGIVTVFYLIVIERCLSQLSGRKKQHFRFDFSGAIHAVRYAAPVAIQQMIMYLCTFGLSPLVNRLGAYASAGYTVAIRAYDMCQSFYMSSSRTVSNYVAQCAGAGKFRDISKGMRVGFLQGTVFCLIPMLPLALFPRFACGLFFETGYTGPALDIAVQFCQYFLPFVLFGMINNQFHAFYRGFAAMRMLIASTAVGAVTRLVLSYALMSMEMNGIYLAWAISWAVEMVFALVIYLLRYRNEDQLRQRCHEA